jgi:hypothetical protein
VAALLHVVVWVMGWPWPHRFSATMVLLMAITWAVSGGDRASRMMHKAAFGFMPETGGRGLWSGSARRRVLERLLEGADRSRLTGPGTGLVVSALAVDSGRVCHFTSWPDPDPEFVARVERELGEVVPVRDADELLDAVIASSAIPGLFEPQRIGGRDYVDAGGFANQPIHVVLASVADAALVVLMSPSASPTPAQPLGDVVALGNRLLEIATWRDLQAELRQLPPGWGREGDPARVCVVEPGVPLPSSLLMFDGEKSSTLVDLGVQDTWAALDRAGWLERSERDGASTR